MRAPVNTKTLAAAPFAASIDDVMLLKAIVYVLVIVGSVYTVIFHHMFAEGVFVGLITLVLNDLDLTFIF